MKIGIASDHRGYLLKKEINDYLKQKDFQVMDYGTNDIKPVDYSDYGIILGEKIINKEIDYGIAFCGSGIGISIACNKVKGIRCAKVDNLKEAIQAREHLDANVIAISSEKELEEIKRIILTFLTTEFSNLERHNIRIDKIKKYEGMTRKSES
ncbi:MAG: RpiB/LacA/LacB family sugar-phosphate isomerase [Bacilli bacterium]|jgi:ribose 5-phosphate isomerase B|nr:RpiB/LacA/LacB family sugar-phosphate isomerase [Bacilli bacterium]